MEWLMLCDETGMKTKRNENKKKNRTSQFYNEILLISASAQHKRYPTSIIRSLRRRKFCRWESRDIKGLTLVVFDDGMLWCKFITIDRCIIILVAFVHQTKNNSAFNLHLIYEYIHDRMICHSSSYMQKRTVRCYRKFIRVLLGKWKKNESSGLHKHKGYILFT